VAACPITRSGWRACRVCSYSEYPDRHRVKPVLNRVVRRWLDSHEVVDSTLPQPRATPERATVLVIGELFDSTHAMFRCYAAFVRQLATRYRVVLMAARGTVDKPAKALFDETIEIHYESDGITRIVEQVRRLAPDMIYYPSVGMSHWGVALANLRLAPIQFMGLGHPASSFSEQMDYIIVGRDLIGDPGCYSEKVIVLDSPGSLWEMRHDAEPVAADIRAAPEVLRVAVPSRIIKLTAGFLALCRQLVERSPRPLELHFFPNETGLLHAMACAEIGRQLPGAVVHRRTGYNDYVAQLNRCDVALSSFPFGNANGSIDVYRQGIPMVVFRGPQPHSLTDPRILAAFGGPDWLVADSAEAYLETALRLVGDDAQRIAASEQLLAGSVDERLFRDEHARYPTDFVDTVTWLYHEHETVQASSCRVWTHEERGMRAAPAPSPSKERAV